jgi:hypothetical protein
VMTLDIVRQKPIEDFSPIWTSALFGGAVLSASIYLFNRRDF